MLNRNSLKLLAPLALVSLGGCGGAVTNTVETQDDAAKILAATSAATSGIVGTGEKACESGGTAKIEVSAGADLLKGEISTTTTFTYSGCVSKGVTLNGSLSRVEILTPTMKLTTSGHIDTSLGTCVVDIKGTTLSAAVTGTFCGFDYNSFSGT